jgi:glycerol-3-phosphate acyltransferase PlsY
VTTLPPAAKPKAPIERRFFHLFAASLFPTLSFFVPKTPLMLTAVSVAIAFVLMEWLRLRWPPLNAFLTRYFQRLMKQKERRTAFASTSLMVATAVSMVTMPKAAYTAGLFFTAVADPFAALIGERWGRRRWFDKTVEGSLVFFSAALGIGAIIWAGGLGVSYWIILIGAIIATLAEVLPILGLDDNFKVPLASGAVMMLFISLT